MLLPRKGLKHCSVPARNRKLLPTETNMKMKLGEANEPSSSPRYNVGGTAVSLAIQTMLFLHMTAWAILSTSNNISLITWLVAIGCYASICLPRNNCYEVSRKIVKAGRYTSDEKDTLMAKETRRSFPRTTNILVKTTLTYTFVYVQ